MNIREMREAWEADYLSCYASLSKNTRGRDREEQPCDIRTAYQRDRDRILHCKSFRRLKHKTQVFLAPEGDHYRTRLTHTLEVAQISRTISRALRLNEDLTEAIALGHDLGHTPFGHIGERTLDELMLLSAPEEIELIQHLASYTSEIVAAAKDYDPARITRYVITLATLFHKFYNACRVKGEEDSLTQARLSLCLAVNTVIENVLTMFKITAPEKM